MTNENSDATTLVVRTSRTIGPDSHVPKDGILWREGHNKLTSFREILLDSELRNNAEIDLHIRYRTTWDAVKRYMVDVQRKTPEEIDNREKKTIDMLIWYNYGSRIWNETIQSATEPVDDNSTDNFSTIVRSALEDPNFFGHAYPHVRNVDAVQKAMIIIVGPDVYDETGILTVTAALKPGLHDFTQLLLEQQKFINIKFSEGWEKLDLKDDHKESAAVFAGMIRPLARQIGHMSEELARAVFSVLESDILVHDRLLDFAHRLGTENKLHAKDLELDEMYEAYMNGSLYLHDLSDAERYLLMRERQKQSANKRKFNPSIFGEDGFPDHVMQRFSKSVERVKQDTVRVDVQTLGIRLDLIPAYASIFNIPDIFEMMVPGKMSVLRKEQVDRRRRSVLFDIKKDVAEVISDTPVVSDWNLSDWSRAMYEVRAMVKVAQESLFGDNKLFMQFLQNTVLYNMIQIEETFEQFARGNSAIEQELDMILQVRVSDFVIKMLTKAGLSDGQIVKFIEDTHGLRVAEVSSMIETYLPGNNQYKLNYYYRLGQIQKQLGIVYDNLKAKPGPSGLMKEEGKVFVYSDEDIAHLHQNFMEIFEGICTAFGLDKEQIYPEYSRWSSKSKVNLSEMIRGGGYDSSQRDMSNARRVNPIGFSVEIDR